MQTDRLNHLQILLKRRYYQSHLLIHLGKRGKVRHYLWDKHVNEEGETLQDLGKSWSICCWRPLEELVRYVSVRNDPDREGPAVGRGIILIFLRLLPAPSLLPAQTWTRILCYYLYPVCHPEPDLSLYSLILLQEHICQLLAHHWMPLQLAATFLSLVPFSFSFLLHFTSSNSLESSILSWTWHPALPLSANRSARDGKCHLSWWRCTKHMDQKYLLPGFWIIAADCLHSYSCFGYVCLTLVSSFSQLLRIFLGSFLERALLLQPLSLMTRWDGLNILTQSLLYLSHFLRFFCAFFFF